VQFIGSGLLGDYRGEYKAFLRAEQVSGANGDIGVALQLRMGSTDSFAPARLGTLVDLQTHDNGYELVDLGQFSIPFHEVADTDYVGADIILEVQAAVNTGSGQQLRIADLIMMPVDEWSITLEDPISDNDLGTSALWGNQYIEYDSGILGHKVGKYQLGSGGAFPAENWFYSGKPFLVEPNMPARIYFLVGHWHPSLGWGNEPLVSDPSSLLAVEIRAQALYLGLRGSE
jgi:hypothetical protein